MSERVKNSEKELLAIISSSVHDMKTPLTSIAGFADAMLDGTVPHEKHGHYLQVIRDEAERLRQICEELLEASKIESGTKSYSMKPFDICETARKVLISMESAINDKKLDVFFEAPHEGITALGDENSITRVLYNICDNAVKFSYEGGALRILLRTDGKMAEVSIENKGEGMSAEELDKIFLPFYKKGERSGTGLGMFIAKNIVDAHGGSIRAESTLGERTVFTVRIDRG
ncbi:MAG: HAMP domain-containing histidine kinase [Clostridia bacterium]|nr:HAMP domain-containing histidine kinase [Clostridia bacterium]